MEGQNRCSVSGFVQQFSQIQATEEVVSGTGYYALKLI